MKKTITTIAIGSLLGAGAAQAAVIASDDFTYTDTEDIGGQTGGTGWAGAWTGRGGDFVVTGGSAGKRL